MTALADAPSTAPEVADDSDLESFGYRPQLHRSIGSYGSFAAGFSFVSIPTTVFQLFSFGFGFGGPSFFWTWPIVFGGQMLVALCFAELASRYPISGCIYQWSRRLSNSASSDRRRKNEGIGWGRSSPSASRSGCSPARKIFRNA